MSQNHRILRHLQKGHSITPLIALSEFGAFRLGARIFELRKAGHDIRKVMHIDENGRPYAKYYLHTPSEHATAGGVHPVNAGGAEGAAVRPGR